MNKFAVHNEIMLKLFSAVGSSEDLIELFDELDLVFAHHMQLKSVLMEKVKNEDFKMNDCVHDFAKNLFLFSRFLRNNADVIKELISIVDYKILFEDD